LLLLDLLIGNLRQSSVAVGSVGSESGRISRIRRSGGRSAGIRVLSRYSRIGVREHGHRRIRVTGITRWWRRVVRLESKKVQFRLNQIV